MRQPLTALLWQSWRLSRRWYVWVLCAALTIHLALLNAAIGLIPDAGLARLHMASVTCIANFAFALFAALLAITLGGRTGFPLRFEFRLPLPSAMLVAVPMLYLAAICASLYLIPALLGRLLYGIAFPLLAPGALLATLVAALLAGSWCSTTTASRSVAFIAVFLLGSQIAAWLDPIHLPDLRNPGAPGFNADIMSIAPAGYGLLAGLCLALLGITVTCVGCLRRGEAPSPFAGFAMRAGQGSGEPGLWLRAAFSSAALLERISDLYTLHCPVGAAWRAELWVELKRRAVHIVLLGVCLALLTPLLLWSGLVRIVGGPAMLDFVLPLVVLFAGLGLGVFNRRESTAGYMSSFEATRGMSTLALAAVQVLAIALSTLAGLVVVGIALHFSAPLLEDPAAIGRWSRLLLDGQDGRPPLLSIADGIGLLFAYLSVVALFLGLHSCSVLWGRKFLVGMAVVALYGIVFTSLVGNRYAGLDVIKAHMWGFALGVALVTALTLASTLRLGVLTRRAVVAGLLGWGVFLLSSLTGLAQRGLLLAGLSPDLYALGAALLALPFTLFLLTAWSYDRLRHR